MINIKIDKNKVLEIVKGWDVGKESEYREFKCAKCGRPIRKAWHVWLNLKGYKIEVHFCKKCFEEVRREE